MIGIGPILVIMGVIAIIGTYLAIIHRALQSSEINESEGKLTAKRNLDSAPRSNPSQAKQSAVFVPMKC
jgi:hypothetical protein